MPVPDYRFQRPVSSAPSLAPVLAAQTFTTSLRGCPFRDQRVGKLLTLALGYPVHRMAGNGTGSYDVWAQPRQIPWLSTRWARLTACIARCQGTPALTQYGRLVGPAKPHWSPMWTPTSRARCKGMSQHNGSWTTVGNTTRPVVLGYRYAMVSTPPANPLSVLFLELGRLSARLLIPLAYLRWMMPRPGRSHASQYPSGCPLSLPNRDCDPQVDLASLPLAELSEEIVIGALRSFPIDTTPGPSGLRIQYLRKTGPPGITKAWSNTLSGWWTCLRKAKFVWQWRLSWRELDWLQSRTLTAVAVSNPNGGICPITIGEVPWYLTAKWPIHNA